MAVQVRNRSHCVGSFDAHSENHWLILVRAATMTLFDKLKLYLLGNEDEDVSWLAYFLISSVVTCAVGLIVHVISRI
jgi:hypothetical protein